ncbi:MAG: caspase family protein [Lewinellaceae bacterium]|nr:caspase family protein [Lewinellaceae bacterium]
MKTKVLVLVLLLSTGILSAQEKGVTPVGAALTVAQAQKGATYAVVIGISDYQDPAIPDLRFADRDATAFAAYLQAPAGGSLPSENLKLLTNTAATTAQIAAALEWLVEVSKEGDQAIIYFSGHGDVETKTMFQLGYLLSWDSPARTYVAGAFPLSYLQAIVSTLALQNKAQVVLITDACRAGKLAGTAVGGPQITNANLTKQFANEVKILSCQPDEFSIEGEQWGGGRGVFSYHLVDGLYGLADGSSDGQVNLFEIGRYLEDKVSKEASPHSQFPMTAGSKNTLLAQVDAGALALLKEQRSKETPVLTTIDPKGFEDMLLAGIDSNWQQKYRQFTAAVAAGQLLDAPSGQSSAYDLYLELSRVEALQRLHGTMQRNLAAALQDDAQQAVNAYLAANPTELANRYAKEADYGRYPRYLEKAAEILGEQNFYYPYVMAKLRYFEGLQIRLDADNNQKSATYQQAIDKQVEALKYQEFAPFILNELGVLHTRLKRDKKAFEYYEKAIDLAPEWGLPYINYSVGLFYTGQIEKAIDYGEKALVRMPDYPQVYNFLAWICANDWSWLDKTNWDRKGVELRSDFRFAYDDYADAFQREARYKRSVELLEKAVLIDSNNVTLLYNLGFVYKEKNRGFRVESELNRAIFLLKKAAQLEPEDHLIYAAMGLTYLIANKYEPGIEAQWKAIELSKIHDSNYMVAVNYLLLANIYHEWGKPDTALEYFKMAMKSHAGYENPYYNSAFIYADKGDWQQAEWHILKAIQLAPNAALSMYGAAEILSRLNRYEDAQWFCQKAIERNPDYTQAKVLLLYLYQETGGYAKALAWLQEMMSREPMNPNVYANAGVLAYQNKQAGKAKQYFDKAVELATDPLTPNEIAYFCIKHSEFEWAESYLHAAFSMDSTYCNNYDNLAMLYALSHRQEEIQPLLDKGVALQPNARLKSILMTRKSFFAYLAGQPDAFVQYAQAAEVIEPAYQGLDFFSKKLAEKDYPTVHVVLAEIIKMFPNDRLVNYLNCATQLHLQKPEAALQSLDKAFELGIPFQLVTANPELEPLRQLADYQKIIRRHFPEKFDDLDTFPSSEPEGKYFPENCVLLAKFYETQGEYERAKFLYERAISLKPDTLSNKLAMSVAKACLQLGKYEEAKAICPEEFEPDDAEQHLPIGKLYYQLGRPDKAEAHFAAYVQKVSRSNRAQQVAWFYHQHGEHGLAERYLMAALEINPSFHGPYYDLGWLHFTCGDAAKAIQAMEEGIRAFPNEFDLKGIKAMIQALSDPSAQPGKAFETLEAERPDMAQVGACLNLMRAKKYEEATAAYQTITREIKDWWVARLLRVAYVRMLIAKGDLDAAMDVIGGDTWAFSYPLLNRDAALAPLRETARFGAFVQKRFPEKTMD